MAAVVLAAAAAAACPAGFTLMAPAAGGSACEDLRTLNGSVRYVGGKYDGLVLGKRVYAQGMRGDWGGRAKAEVIGDAADLLARDFLADGRDPDFDAVLNAVPPVINGWGANANFAYAGQHTFTGSRDSDTKAVFDHLGDAGIWTGYPRPPNIIDTEWALGSQNVAEGIIGGDLQTVHFVYTVNASVRWEMTAVPVDDNDGSLELPVFFRFIRVVTAAPRASPEVTRQVIVDTYAYNPGYQQDPEEFYTALAEHRGYWDREWRAGGLMNVSIPNAVLRDQAVHSIGKDMITRMSRVWPRYGVCGDPGGCAYGDPHSHGFQEIFTSSVTAALEWGLYDYARDVVRNYLRYFVRRNGGIHYRGLEMAQHGRILTCLGMYYQHTGDAETFKTYASGKITGIVDLLLARIHASRDGKNTSDPAYGIPVGDDEADLFHEFVDVGPARGKTELPFYSIATEAARGFQEIAEVFRTIPELNLTDYAGMLLEERAQLMSDILASLAKSVVRAPVGDDPAIPCWPYVAGSGVCDELPSALGPSIRDSEPWRTYPEMLYSSVLPKDVVNDIVDWSLAHRQMTRFAVPAGTGSDCCGSFLQTFTVHGWGYGLLAAGRTPLFLLHLYAVSSHAYTRGTWTALEETDINTSYGQPYCTSAQLTVPLYVKWMLVFDDVATRAVWFGRGLPRAWIADLVEGRASAPIAAAGVASRYGGRVGFMYTAVRRARGRQEGEGEREEGEDALDATPLSIHATATLNHAPGGHHFVLRAPPGYAVYTAALEVAGRGAVAVAYDTAREAVHVPVEHNGLTVALTFDLVRVPAGGRRGGY